VLLDGINLIIFISKNGEKVPRIQKILLFLFIFQFFKKEIRQEKIKNKKPVGK
jgi:hypothetical protein